MAWSATVYNVYIDPQLFREEMDDVQKNNESKQAAAEKNGKTATDIVDVTVLPEFYDVAGAVGFIATESLEGKLRLRAAKAPTEKISAQYHITSTVKYTDAQEGGT